MCHEKICTHFNKMRLNKKCLLAVLVISILLIVLCTLRSGERNGIVNIFRDHAKLKNLLFTHSAYKQSKITVAVVACGQRLQETLNMLKSAILFNRGKPPIRFIILAEENLKTAFMEKLADWQEAAPGTFRFDIMSLKFPEKNQKEWKSLFKPCAAQRLFLPSLLSTVDSVLYLDTDTLFLSPVSDIWEHFNYFNSSQIAGLSPEHEDKNVGWYNRFARHPFYGPLGVNSGVMLMNLTRMRQFKWEDHILPIHEEYKMKITWGDQDLINILFYYHPDKLYVFPCQFNYRPDHCMYMNVCNATRGIQILHGNRGYFHSDKQPAFSTVYSTLEAYQLGKDPYRNFVRTLETALADESVVSSNCGKISYEVIAKAKKIFPEIDYYYS